MPFAPLAAAAFARSPWSTAALALAALSLALLIGIVKIVRERNAALRAVDDARHDVRRSRERTEALGRQLDELARSRAPTGSARTAALAALPAVFETLGGAPDRTELCDEIGRAVERTLSPSQWMVFTANDEGGMVLRAAASRSGATWPVGSVLTEQHGRLGHVLRTRSAMHSGDFDDEPPMVKARLRADEPRGFTVDAAVPIRVGERVVGLVSAGRPGPGPAVARAILECVAAQAATVMRRFDARDLAQRLEDSDDRTGLGNRRWFLAQAAEALYRNRDSGVPTTLAVFGVDHLQRYLDRNRAVATDRLQRAVSDLARAHAPQGALLARWAEDEFVALFPGRDAASARQVLDGLRRATAELEAPGADRQPGGAITLSAGFAAFPEDGVQLDDLLDGAYSALEVARGRGGDQVTSTQSRASDSVSFRFGRRRVGTQQAADPPAPPEPREPSDAVRLPPGFGTYEDVTVTPTDNV